MYVKTNSECVIKPHLHSPQMNNSGDILMIKLKIAIFKKIMMKRQLTKVYTQVGGVVYMEIGSL